MSIVQPCQKKVMKLTRKKHLLCSVLPCAAQPLFAAYKSAIEAMSGTANKRKDWGLDTDGEWDLEEENKTGAPLHWSKKLADEKHERARRDMKPVMVQRKRMGRGQTGPPAEIWETNLPQRSKKPPSEWNKWEVSCHSWELGWMLFACFL